MGAPPDRAPPSQALRSTLVPHPRRRPGNRPDVPLLARDGPKAPPGPRQPRYENGPPAAFDAPGPVFLVGADIPNLDAPHITEAFKALGHAPAAIGPAPDGGYWGIGLKRTATPAPNLLTDVRWSTEHALADTLRTLPHPVARLTTLADVDTADDLRSSLGTKYPRRRPQDAPTA